MKKTYNQMQQMISALNLNEKSLYLLLTDILTPNQLRVFFYRFDNEGNIVKTMDEIGNILNCTKQNVNIILNKIYKLIELEVLKRNPKFKSKTKKSKKRQLMETIKQTHKLPNYNKKFEDGTYQRSYYKNLLNNYNEVQKKIKNKLELTEKDRIIIKDFEDINKLLIEYEDEIVLSEKAKELIKTIKKLHRLPQIRHKKEPEAVFSNGTDQRNYYNYLSFSKNPIIKKKEQGITLTKTEKQILFDYAEIVKVLNKYQKLPTKNPECKTKKEEFIQTIYKNHRLPKRTDFNYGIVDEYFSNGDIQRVYYENLRWKASQYKKLQNEEYILNDYQLKIINDYNEISNVLSFYPKKYNQYRALVVKLCNYLNIKLEDNNILMNKSFYEIYVKIVFMIENNIQLTKDGKINEIIYMSDANMQEKYNVSIEELVSKYINGSINCETALKILEKK